MKRTALEMLWSECVGSLLLGDECAAREASVYFCCLSFQGPDWQLFLEPESHSLLNPTSSEEEEGEGSSHRHTRTLHVTARSRKHLHFQARTRTWASARTKAPAGAMVPNSMFRASSPACTGGSVCVGRVTAASPRERGTVRDLR